VIVWRPGGALQFCMYHGWRAHWLPNVAAAGSLALDSFLLLLLLLLLLLILHLQ
jgi:membrane-associated protease RseP (regulator of RpoE activity)